MTAKSVGFADFGKILIYLDFDGGIDIALLYFSADGPQI
jgi:hypothetical protein